MQRAVVWLVLLVLERERTPDGPELVLGSGAVAATKMLAADGIVVRQGELVMPFRTRCPRTQGAAPASPPPTPVRSQ